MARKKIREYDSKRLVKEHYKRISGFELAIKSAHVTESTDLNELIEREPWLSSSKLVVKPVHTVICSKCHFSSHRICISPPVAGPLTYSHAPSPCSTCLNPNRLVFDPKPEISYMSMSKAEAAAVTEADRRAKEASYMRKRAREGTMVLWRFHFGEGTERWLCD
ncbi:hypothetical protein L2E82_08057 [Cichorium intybus]|uniref:Uncharacterized protein n=1 Tax=Cichorium intybus TaxID=13427 RepID=A0ACB9G4X9_CICIN|nr:hypothetical protein L2E82_08057 [Cichorium intybus]